MTIDHLRLFLAISRTGSLSEAARSQGLSQSAASQALAQLEGTVAALLLDRSRRPMALTAAGRRFKAGVESLLDGWDRLLAGLKPAGTGLAGTVTVAAIHSQGIHLLAGLVERFAALHPQVHVQAQHLRHGQVVQAVRERRVDLGIVSFPPRLRAIEAIHLRDEALVAVCHPAHRLVPRRRLALRELAGQRLVAFDRDLPVRQAIDAALRAAGIAVEVAMELDNIESIKQAVQNRCGLAILPEPMVLRETLGRMLVALPFEDVRLSRPIAVLRHRSFRDPAADAFVAFLQESTHQQAAGPGVPIAPLRYGQTPSQFE